MTGVADEEFIRNVTAAYSLQSLAFTSEAALVLQERWSDKSPEEGTELCVCSWCGKMIGRDPDDAVWEDHIEYCTGCEICEIALRVWKDNPDHPGSLLELRFHQSCMDKIIVKIQ